MEIRCPNKFFGVLIDDHTLEIKCHSKFCGHEPGVVVLHRFDLRTGAAETKRYKDTPPRLERTTE